jgi:hypothetical protein
MPTIKEELSREDKSTVKDMIKSQLLALFYKLYIKKSFWS